MTLTLQWITFVAGSLVLAACADETPEALDGGDADAHVEHARASDSLYEPDRVLEIELTLDEADWERIRYEGRSTIDVLSGCYGDYAYGYAMASARIDGDEVPEVAVRKKGFLGSLSSLRPSLRLDFDELSPGAKFRGVTVLTLNNNHQDRAQLRQCMAYEVFRAAGLPAPRCAFARVTVNGEDLGIYTNVEPIRKPLLARHFEDDEGNLYEGNPGSDFRPDTIERFERKTNEDDVDRGDLRAIAEALELEPDDAITELERLIDMDAFLRFWAVESLISHWDGYSGNLNNFYVYVDPKSEQLAFIPWGTDSSFERDHAFLPEVGRPASVLASARLPERLYAWPKTRERYRQAMQELLDTVWDEDRWLAEVDRIAELLGDAADPAALEEQRELIRTRRAEIQAELDRSAPAWSFGERELMACMEDLSQEVAGSFEVAWGDLDAIAASHADNAFEVVLDGEPLDFTGTYGTAGPFDDGGPTLAGPSIRLLHVHDDFSYTAVQVTVGPRPLEPGTYRFHGVETAGMVVTGTSLTDARVRGFIGDGELVIEEASTEPGGTVRGHFTGRFVPVKL